MDINRIRYFLTLAETNHLGKAAELHRISAPAFSKAMKIFAEEMGLELFIPQGRGILLTEKARALVPELKEIISKLDSLVKKESGVEDRLRIATFEVFSTHFMEELLSTVFPDKFVTVIERTPGKMEAAVADGTVDLALTYNPVPRAEVEFLKVSRIEMGIFGKNENLPFVVPVSKVEGAPSKVKGLDGWPDDKFPRKIAYEVELMESALGLCRKGLAIAYLPKFIVALHNQKVKAEFRLHELPLPPRMKQGQDYVYIVKRKSRSEDSVVKKLAAGVRKLSLLA